MRELQTICGKPPRTDLNHEQAFAVVGYQSCTPNRGQRGYSVLNLEGIHHATRIMNRCVATACKPKAAESIEISGVPGPVPKRAVYFEFCFPVS